MRYAFLAVLFVAGCGESIRPGDEWEQEAGSEGTTVHIDPAMLNNPTSELGTDRTRGIAKTIEWMPISTEDGVTYGDDAVVVERILRDDADNNYGVRVRLKNTTKDVRKLQWLIRFYTRHGSQIAAYVGGRRRIPSLCQDRGVECRRHARRSRDQGRAEAKADAAGEVVQRAYSRPRRPSSAGVSVPLRGGASGFPRRQERRVLRPEAAVRFDLERRGGDDHAWIEHEPCRNGKSLRRGREMRETRLRDELRCPGCRASSGETPCCGNRWS
jgi:hypothetical protein